MGRKGRDEENHYLGYCRPFHLERPGSRSGSDTGKGRGVRPAAGSGVTRAFDSVCGGCGTRTGGEKGPKEILTEEKGETEESQKEKSQEGEKEDCLELTPIMIFMSYNRGGEFNGEIASPVPYPG